MISTVPAVLDALVARWTEALPEVQVADGQPVVTENDLIAVGLHDVPGEPAVNSTRTIEQLAAQPDRESYDVSCIASSFTGAVEFKPIRDRVYELVNAAAGALAADQTLGGLVMVARLTSDDLIQEQTEQGAVATVRFTVHVEAFTD
ncbi:hypothetical protein GCM10010182_67600 [Actinomadura cremea]|nr:hypothetical protein GCM10010182_67600 [Actinomadura cremea]